ncbi:S27A2 synthetase, partial [Turnix velox]|nr:S27A2 synthetase [Turnix velox]
PARTLVDVFEGHAARWPGRPFLLFQEQVLTFQQLQRKSNAAARLFLDLLALPRAHPVAVLLPNEPTYVWTWLALAKLGWPMACLNTNARGAALTHAVRAAKATVLLATKGQSAR